MSAPPNTPAGFTPDFLTRAMHDSGALPSGVSVVAAHATLLGGDSGNTGAQIFRIALEYSSATELPATVVLKFCDTSKMVTPTQRGNAIERGIILSTGYSDVRMIELETSFYSRFADVIAKPMAFRTPKIYYCGMSGGSTRLSLALFVAFGRLLSCKGAVIMEDLSAGETHDAIGSVPTPRFELVLQAMARFHGYSAALLHNKPDALGPLPRAFNYDLTYMTNGVARLVKRGMKPGVAQRVLNVWGNTDLAVLKNEPGTYEALRALEKRYGSHVYPMLARRHAFPCVVHGDLHVGNFYFMPGEASAANMCSFDWQMWGTAPSPVQEVHYLFASHLLDDRQAPDRAEDERLLRMYHGALMQASGGVVDFPFELLRRDFDVASLDYLAAMMMRRARVDTPASVLRSAKKKGAGRLVLGIQRLLKFRETVLLQRAMQLHEINPAFEFA